jgi:hypothetical protein
LRGYSRCRRERCAGESQCNDGAFQDITHALFLFAFAHRANARHGGQVRFEISLTMRAAGPAAIDIACCNSAGFGEVGSNYGISTYG